MISVKDVSKIYNLKTNSEVIALNSVTFSIKKGEIVNIIGKSGSGKSTLVNILLGITKPTNGEFLIDENKYNKKSKKRKLRLITNNVLSSFQYPDYQIFNKTVEEELFFNVSDKKYAINLFKEFKFDKKILKNSPFNLSSGQKRKLILVSILSQKPDVIIFDEATAFLDPQSRKEFIELIKKINIKLNTTIIFISHNFDDAISLTNRTIMLSDGKIVYDGDTKFIINQIKNGDQNGK